MRSLKKCKIYLKVNGTRVIKKIRTLGAKRAIALYKVRCGRASPIWYIVCKIIEGWAVYSRPHLVGCSWSIKCSSSDWMISWVVWRLSRQFNANSLLDGNRMVLLFHLSLSGGRVNLSCFKQWKQRVQTNEGNNI